MSKIEVPELTKVNSWITKLKDARSTEGAAPNRDLLQILDSMPTSFGILRERQHGLEGGNGKVANFSRSDSLSSSTSSPEDQTSSSTCYAMMREHNLAENQTQLSDYEKQPRRHESFSKKPPKDEGIKEEAPWDSPPVRITDQCAFYRQRLHLRGRGRERESRSIFKFHAWKIDRDLLAKVFKANSPKFKPQTSLTLSNQVGPVYLPTSTNKLEAYIHKPLVPFLPYVDKQNATLPEYKYSKPSRKWIDLKAIRSWTENCEKYHSNHCISAHEAVTASLRPLYFIDVRLFCLVPAENIQRYVTLSYVWGKSAATSTTLANLASLKEQNSLKGPNIVLPRTITDAVKLVESLGRLTSGLTVCVSSRMTRTPNQAS